MLRSRKSVSPTSLQLIAASVLALAAIPGTALAQSVAASSSPPQQTQASPAAPSPAPDKTAASQPPTSPSDLIPDSAVADPDAWAGHGAPPKTGDDAASANAPEPDSPFADSPLIALPWPDQIDLPQLVPLSPDTSIEFADVGMGANQPTESSSDVVRITREVELAFPEDPSAFPQRADFASHYRSLSTIAELDSGKDNVAQLAVRARSDEELLGTLLRDYGYYDGQVFRSLGGEIKSADRPQVRFDIVPGTQFKFGSINLGDLSRAPDAEALRKAFAIQTGDPLSSFVIEAQRANLDTALGESGYPFAKIDPPSLLIDHDTLTGDLAMPVHPNGKFVIGQVVSDKPRFLSSNHLAEIARFKAGDVYRRSLAVDLRRAIVATGLVASATVTPRAVTQPDGDKPGTVDMDVALTEAKLRTIAGAIGYGTGEGFRVQGSWEHRNLFPPEGMLRVRAIAGTQEQLGGVTFRKNNFHGRDKILTIDTFASTISTDAYDADTLSMIGTLEKTSTLLFQKPFSWSTGLELVATRQRELKKVGKKSPFLTYFIAALPTYAQIDTSDDLLNPTRGYRLAGRISPEVSTNNGVQSFYVRTQVDASFYKAIGTKSVLAGRVRLGAIPGAPLAAIAPSRRFYAGGGGSVRGYAYQAISPLDAYGGATGGRSLAEASLEARIGTALFDGALQVVPFVDAGAVSQSVTPTFDDVRVGAGIGVRYLTGFGPLRVDIATPINPRPTDSRIGVYVSLGQAF
ncbi:autotransporter assembly complex protein TamA [Tsuneonella mangrovi]|uniref:autotransporter assembly complex protein TamA n=1 Tax=Tsuneonella mangrovi TaxID=1982042 RepID=UPI000BA209B4|nr:BamA/TamA family outer membrane protein [Tsuneonella mangrovi]